MMHEQSDVLKLAQLMSKKIIAFENKCKNQEFKNDEIKCHELNDIAAMARLVCADIGDV